MNIDIRNLQKWLNEEQEAPIDRQALARVLAMAEQPAQQHIEHCLWARNGNQPCPHVQPAQEPFGYFRAEPFGWTNCAETDDGAIALYTSPQPSKPWVGLTTADLDEIDAPIRERGSATISEIYRAIEAKLRGKNA